LLAAAVAVAELVVLEEPVCLELLVQELHNLDLEEPEGLAHKVQLPEQVYIMPVVAVAVAPILD
jgi:hypothetical protein